MSEPESYFSTFSDNFQGFDAKMEDLEDFSPEKLASSRLAVSSEALSSTL